MTTRRGIAAFLLLALLARALIPAGFMPVAGDGAMQLVVCDGVHHHPASDRGRPGSPSTHDGPCAFAASAGPGLLNVISDVAIAFVALATTVVVFEFSVPVEAPPRHTAARGPPSNA